MKKEFLTKEYRAWINMRQRCLNKKNPDYKKYGGRDIYICDRWDDYDLFLEDMGRCPEGLSLDRFPNTAMIYSKETCRWATKSEQCANRNPYGKTRFKGVYLDRCGNYQAIIKFKNKLQNIGIFKTPELASLAFEACRYVLYTSGEL